MEKLGTISFEEVSEEERKRYRIRKASRAVVRDQAGNIALLSVTKHSYHKLPGGGIEDSEGEIVALRRECLEEIGCEIEVGEAIGEVQEFRDKIKINQTSACYQAKLKGEKGEPHFTEDEINKGFRLVWVTPEAAVKLIQTDTPDDYEGKFIQKRDLLFLQGAFFK